MDGSRLQARPSSPYFSERTSNDYSPRASLGIEHDRRSTHSITHVPQLGTALAFPHFSESHESIHRINASEINDPNPRITVEASGTSKRRQDERKNIVLCFDGTGNQFHGDSSDSNILKIFRMLDRSSGSGFHYYQPGIGTYVASASLNTTGSIQKLKNWYKKAKDAAIGTSFDEHVVGGYKFLMQYYSPGDNIYMFGFSRGSYTARFLAEMLDWVGLITHGNEEMIQFAWHTFSKWKAIDSNSKEAREKQKKAYEFMVSFRETFSRPVRRIRFLGLFDTVNSVPRFENAILSRHRIPFSAVSSAKTIRHAVSIDERRAKFRADLVSTEYHHRRVRDTWAAEHIKNNPQDWFHHTSRYKSSDKSKNSKAGDDTSQPVEDRAGRLAVNQERRQSRYRRPSRARSHPTTGRSSNASPIDLPNPSITGNSSAAVNDTMSFMLPAEFDDDSSDSDESDQDIDELWFPGGHADIGGGWEINDGETPLSHVPLVWIVREAKKSGLAFDEEKMRTLHCWDDSEEIEKRELIRVPTIELPVSPTEEKAINEMADGNGEARGALTFKSYLLDASTKGVLHDCLELGQGLPIASVLRWRIMEWIPFRRLDLTDNGKWKPIRWPLPRGEVRDMPADAKVHHSAIMRMQQVPSYRPGNLILGGGGRGVKKAPKEAGIGEWEIVAEEGDIIGERVVRKSKQNDNNGHKKD